MFYLYDLWRGIWAEKRRFWMTVLSVAWAVAAIALMLSIGEGLRNTYGNAMEASGKGLLVIQGGTTSEAAPGIPLNQPFLLKPQDWSTLQQAGLPARFTPEYEWNAALQAKTTASQPVQMQISAVNPDFASFRTLKIQSGGRFLDEEDNRLARRVVVLGEELAKLVLGDPAQGLKQTIFIDNIPFQVIGILKSKLQLSSYTTLDNYHAWIPFNTYRALNKALYINYLLAVPDTAEQMPLLKQQIRILLAFNHGLSVTDQTFLLLDDTLETQQKTQQFFTGMKWFLGLIGTMTLMVAGIGIANVMLIAVHRSTQEIGIRMAIGAKPYHILLYYLLEALFSTTVGGLIGLSLAKIGVLGINALPFKATFFEFIPKPEATFSPQVLWVVVAILLLIGVIAGLIPARKAAYIQPSEALRYE